MGRNAETVERRMWEAVGAESQENWAVWGAAHDTKILAGLTVIQEYEGRVSPEIIQITKDGLRIYVLYQYDDVPKERIGDVLLAAEQVIKEEKITNGEA